MKNWFNRNYKTIIISAFLIPIITVAIVSISHVTKWYGISNPFTWAVYLSIGVEIAALSALAAISADMGKKVYFPFGIVTLVQFIGNIYFAYSYIDITSQSFTSWVELVSPLLEYIGVEPTDMVGHKRFLAFFAGGMLPIISLSFLHMLVKFTQNDKNVVESETPVVKTSPEPVGGETPVVDAKDIVGEVSRIRPTEDELELLEKYLNKKPKSNVDLVENKEDITTSDDVEEDEKNEMGDVFLIEDHLIGDKEKEQLLNSFEEKIVSNQQDIPADFNEIISGNFTELTSEETNSEPEPIVEETIVQEPQVVEEIIPEPVVEETIVEPVIETIVQEPQVTEEIIQEPQVTEENVFEPVVEETITEPVVEETITEPVVEETITEPELIIEQPIVEETQDELPIEEEKKN